MKKSVYISLLSVVIITGLVVLDYYGIIWHNSIFAAAYEVKGIDVSHHQGKIDWKIVKEKNDFQFAYIKATEGQDFTDHEFSYNWEQAGKYGFVRGAYHFFSMTSTGEAQAKHYIRTVPKEKDSMPPVIDVEVHLKHDPKVVRQEIKTLATLLESHYGKKAILYVTYDTYDTYIKEHFTDYDIWIRDIYKFPTLDQQDWEIWQYSNRGRIDGVDTYIDINVYQGTKEDWKNNYIDS